MVALYIVLGVVALLGVLIALAAQSGARSRRRQLDGLRQALKGSPLYDAQLLGYRRTMPAFDVELDGRKLTLGITFANRMQLCVVEVKRDRLPLVVFRREKLRDRVGRWLFLNREVQTGDDAFDRQVYIETDEDGDIVKQTLATPEARDAILASVERHRAVILSQQGVGGTTLFAPSSDGTLAGIRAALPPLGRIADALPTVDGARGVRQAARGDWLAIAMMVGIAVAYLQVGLVPHLKPDRWEPWMDAQIESVESRAFAAFLVFLLLSFFWIRGHSRSLRNFSFTAIGGLLTIPALSIQTSYMLNALLDRSPVVEHASTITRKSSRSTRSNTYYHVSFPSLFTPGKTAGLDIDYDTWRSFAVGDRIVLGLRAGRFGWMWVDTVRRGDGDK